VRRAALLLVLLVLAGCAGPTGACDVGCHRVWQAQDLAAGSYDALSAGARLAPASGIALPNATLAALYGESYRVASLVYAPNASEDARATLLLNGTAPRLVVAVPPTWNATRIEALARGALANLTRADLAPILAALEANRTEGACCPARTTLSADLAAPLNVSGLWARLKPVVRGDEDHHLDGGEPVTKGAWSFLLSFPTASVQAGSPDGTLHAEANARGRYSVLLELPRDENATQARAALHALLVAAGARDDVDWALVPAA
jgi:hypothetical protein